MLTQARLKELLSYDQETGTLTWKINRQGGKAKIGAHFGWVEKKYRRGIVDGHRYLSHRLIWLYVHGSWPKKQLDHINLNKLDNRIDNLREATNGQNQMNSSVAGNSTTRVKGVHQRKETGRYRIYADVNGRRVNGGSFDTLAEARLARIELAAKLHGDFFRE